jgi:predicted transposase YdaD
MTSFHSYCKKAQQESDCERGKVIVELTEEILIRRYSSLDREEIRQMFKLHDIRKTRVWQEAHEEGLEKGIEKGIEKKGEKKESKKGEKKELKKAGFLKRGNL